MLGKKRGALAILAVVRQARGGEWYRDAESILRQRKLLTDEMVFAERTRIRNMLKDRWKADLASSRRRAKEDANIKERREKAKNDHD